MQFANNQAEKQIDYADMPGRFTGRDGYVYRKLSKYPKAEKYQRYQTEEEADRDDPNLIERGAIWRETVPYTVALAQYSPSKPVEKQTHQQPGAASEPISSQPSRGDTLRNAHKAEQVARQQESQNQAPTVEETDQVEQKKRREVIDLRANEAAFDLWTWGYDHKANEWVIEGIYRTGILSFLNDKQFSKRYRPDGATTFLVQGESIIEPVIATVMRDSIKSYIEADPNPLEVGELKATYESRQEIYNRQHHLIINQTGLEGLNTHARPLLRDTATTCYVPYENGIVEVTRKGIVLQPYEILQGACVWQSQVLQRQFNVDAPGEECHFARFIHNVSNGEPDRIRAFRSSIGYVIHHYGNPAEGQAIICYDEEITNASKPEGGTGKGLYGNGIRQIRPVAVIDGKKHDPNDKFNFQQVNQDTAVVWIDDPIVNHPRPERRFTLEQFFSKLTEGWSIEKKHEHAFRIPAKEGPKLLISSNVVMPNEGTSHVRRQFVLEFSNHYKKQIRAGNEKPIVAEHGCVFFSDDWDAREWQMFDRYMMGCVLDYMRVGLQPYALRSANQNHLRQTAGEDFYEWVTTYQDTGLVSGQEYSRDELFKDYKAYAGLDEKTTITRGFTNNIGQYAKSKNWKYERGKVQRNATFTLSPL